MKRHLVINKKVYFILQLIIFFILLGKIPYLYLNDFSKVDLSNPIFYLFIFKEILIVFFFILFLKYYKDKEKIKYLKFFLLINIILILLIFINLKLNITGLLFYFKNIGLPLTLIFVSFFLNEKIILKIFIYFIVLNFLLFFFQLQNFTTETEITNYLYFGRPKGVTDNPNTVGLSLFLIYSFLLQNLFEELNKQKNKDDFYHNKIIILLLASMCCIFLITFTNSLSIIISLYLLLIFLGCFFFNNKKKAFIVFFITQNFSLILAILIKYLFFKTQFNLFLNKFFLLINVIKTRFLKDQFNFEGLQKNTVEGKINDYIVVIKDIKINFPSFLSEKNQFENLKFLSAYEDFSNQFFFYDSDFLNLIYSFGLLPSIIFIFFILYIICEHYINKKKYNYQNVNKIYIFLISFLIIILFKKLIPLTIANYFLFIILGYRMRDIINNFKKKFNSSE